VKLNPDVKKAWLAALRSGEYQQGKGVLRSENDRFCCLGVLCDLAARARLVTFDADNVAYVSVALPTDRSTGMLPQTVARWAGLTSDQGGVDADPRVEVPNRYTAAGGGSYRMSLSVVNDELNYDFHQIANLIEEYL
jgi:hypothetical protein